MKQLSALITASVLYVVFCLSIDSQFAAEFIKYLAKK